MPARLAGKSENNQLLRGRGGAEAKGQAVIVAQSGRIKRLVGIAVAPTWNLSIAGMDRFRTGELARAYPNERTLVSISVVLEIFGEFYNSEVF
jgi:hypothetical protein